MEETPTQLGFQSPRCWLSVLLGVPLRYSVVVSPTHLPSSIAFASRSSKRWTCPHFLLRRLRSSCLCASGSTTCRFIAPPTMLIIIIRDLDSKQWEIHQCRAPCSNEYKAESNVDQHVFESTRGCVDWCCSPTDRCNSSQPVQSWCV